MKELLGRPNLWEHSPIRYTCFVMPKKIVHNPAILGGRPVLNGTRISVDLILRMVAGGMTIEEIAGQYPHVTKEDIQAALEYAAQRFERTPLKV